jgi:hypothetical protein
MEQNIELLPKADHKALSSYPALRVYILPHPQPTTWESDHQQLEKKAKTLGFTGLERHIGGC